MGRKKKHNNVHEYSLFKKGVLNNFKIQHDTLLLQKKKLLSDIEKRCEWMKAAVPSEVRYLKLGGLPDFKESTRMSQSGKQPCDLALKPQSVANMHVQQVLGENNLEQNHIEYSSSKKHISKFIITSKVNPYSPVSMLRVPNRGEFAVSVAGSPLQVSCAGNDTASVNIPLKNGKIVSVLPKSGINTTVIQENLDPSVKRQLEMLKTSISEILQSSESCT